MVSTLDFGALRAFGSAVAIIGDDPSGPVSYAELADRCEAFAARLGAPRRLVLIEAANSVGAVVAYVGARLGGHVVILAGPNGGGAGSRLVETFAPDAIWRADRLHWSAQATSATLHPDLSLLLPTSGSTGDARLVRLSRGALEANASAIAAYLQITASDRAILSLPLQYSYGMSVLNSHLQAGASVVLTEMSVTDPRFWALAREHRATSLSGVPHSYELLERIGFRQWCPDSLRVLTQAGGRMPPELVRTYAGFARERGMRFYVMYGQTEAGPRMAYLPPDLAASHPDCIGVAIPGGHLELQDKVGRRIDRPGVTGELVYRGPNVMMGYALARDDLAKDAGLEALHTGDLARRTSRGLFRVVGRASRFIKIAGLRIGLDEVEAMLARAGRRAYATGTDERLAICVVGGDARSARDQVASACGLPVALVSVYAAKVAPRLATGKIDYPAIRAAGEREERRALSPLESTGGAIATAFARALAIDLPPGEATFASLGGDSLSYLNAAMGIEKALGEAPLGWESMTVASLDAMTPITRDPSVWPKISCEVLVRVAAMASVIVVHTRETDFLHGGSLVLLALAGYNLARFQRELLLAGRVCAVLAGSFFRMVLPYFVVLAVLLPMTSAERSFSWPLLLSGYFITNVGPLLPFWFIETLFHAMLMSCALFLIPAVRRFATNQPFGSALGWLAAALVFKTVAGQSWIGSEHLHRSVKALLYLFVLGWAARVGQGTWQKVLVLALASGLIILDYGLEPRCGMVVAAFAIVLYAPDIRLPAPVVRSLLSIAAASYFIYLLHILPVQAFRYTQPLAGLPDVIKIPAVLLVAIGLGLAYERVWTQAAGALRKAIRRTNRLRLRSA